MSDTDRRRFMLRGLSAGLLARLGSAGAHAGSPPAHRPPQPPLAPQAELAFGPARAFSFADLRDRARTAARLPYAAPAPLAADLIHTLSFDAVQQIEFRPEFGLWRTGPGPYPVRFFHLNRYVDQPVRIHALRGELSREILYRRDYFHYADPALAAKLPGDLGFAGFRVMAGRNADSDWLAFQGASYFRAAGAENQYGISARGIAVDTALSTREEFPRFTEFWLNPGAEGSAEMQIYALLDGPSVTGAYQFVARNHDGQTIDVRADLFFRANVERVGLAPLTSMYWYRENDLRRQLDWRPAIHDSDGLALWTGAGERIWRPLNDPPTIRTNSFEDRRPRGFGLAQRDRDFNDYQDDGAFYNRRPSVWVEPRGDWGAGAVQLVEIPTDDEIHDNIVAYWSPRAPVTKGATLEVRYRLLWQDTDPPPPGGAAHVVATRLGLGGVPGQERPRDQFKFVIDFAGGELSSLKARFDLQPVVTASRGKVVNPYAIKVVGTTRWRVVFDVLLPGSEVLDLRCFLRLDERTLTETWVYQFLPPAGPLPGI